MSTSVTPIPAGAAVAPVNDVAGEAPTTHVIPPEPGAPTNVHDAGKAFRERLAQQSAPPAETPAAPAAETPTHHSATQPRDETGKFAKDGEPAAAAETPAPEAQATAPEGATEAEVPAAEPKVFVLKGEAQRGEPDIELDATGLPPEVIERLDRAQKQGMRRAEYDTAMGKVRSLQADLDAVETEISVDPQGFVLNHVAPVHRPELAATLLFEHWDDLAPLIQQYWQDGEGRLRMQQQIKNGIASRKMSVQQQVAQARGVMAVRNAVQALIPETADESLASEFNQTALALLASRNQVIDPQQVPELLSGHVRRYFGAAQTQTPEPPAKPKLAVRPTPKPAQQAPATPVVSQDEIARQIQARNAAKNVAPQGAGPGAVQRPGPPPNATVQEASRWWRENANRR